MRLDNHWLARDDDHWSHNFEISRRMIKFQRILRVFARKWPKFLLVILRYGWADIVNSCPKFEKRSKSWIRNKHEFSFVLAQNKRGPWEIIVKDWRRKHYDVPELGTYQIRRKDPIQYPVTEADLCCQVLTVIAIEHTRVMNGTVVEPYSVTQLNEVKSVLLVRWLADGKSH